MITSMKNPVGDQMVNMSSEFCTGMMITRPALQPQQAAAKQKRRRKKNPSNEGVLRKRKLSDEQVNILELNFGSEHKLDSERKDKLASELGLDPNQVAVWFQNRRARWKNNKMEEEYSKLKADHETTVLEKCQLETEVLKLKEQLSYSEKEMQKLFEKCNGFSSNSPASSFSMETMSPQFLADFGMEGIENIFYDNYTYEGIDWGDYIRDV